MKTKLHKSIPCDCGNPVAAWRGSKTGRRMYSCIDCHSAFQQDPKNDPEPEPKAGAMTSPIPTKLDAVVEVAGWQPIDCAPDDEPLLLIANRLVQNVLAFKEDDIWRSAETGDEMEGFHPTHWMRMPAPPSARQLVPALAGMVKAAWLAIEGAPHDPACELNRLLTLSNMADHACDCWRGTALATLTQEIEKLNQPEQK